MQHRIRQTDRQRNKHRSTAGGDIASLATTISDRLIVTILYLLTRAVVEYANIRILEYPSFEFFVGPGNGFPMATNVVVVVLLGVVVVIRFAIC